MTVDSGEMNSDLDPHVAPPSRRVRRIAAGLVGAVGTFTVMLGVLGFLMLSFIGSSSSTSSTVRSALDNANVRRAIADELVTKLEAGGDNGERIVIHVDHSEVVDAVEKSLGDSNLRAAAGNAAAAIYGVYVEGKARATVTIQIFADEAFKVIRLVDPSIPQGVAPRLDPLEIAQSDSSPDFGNIHSWFLRVPWILLVGGLALIAISYFLSIIGIWLWCRRLGIRILISGLTLILLAYVGRSISFGDDSSSHIAEALVSFVTGRLILWSLVLAGIGVVVTLLGAILNQRVTSMHTASA